jgi:spermidine/putrescine transport system substrate-binding protein
MDRRVLRILGWPGMPAPDAIEAVSDHIAMRVEGDTISSNEQLEAKIEHESYDVIFPSDYMVERLRNKGRLVRLDKDRRRTWLEDLEDWAIQLPFDPSCRYSVPVTYGTTGVLYRRGGDRTLSSWAALFAPSSGERVGMLWEMREVIGAALKFTGHSLNATDDASLADARQILLDQQQHVARYSSVDFVEAILTGRLGVHHAWNGPAALAARTNEDVEFAVPREGGTLWVTTAAIPVNASDVRLSARILDALLDPCIAQITVERSGFSTPNKQARLCLSADIAQDTNLFPSFNVLERCEMVRDIGHGSVRYEAIWRELAQQASDRIEL